MALNVKALFSIAGAFKLFELVLAIVTFLLARVGYEGYTAAFGKHYDMMWIGFVATGGWLIIIPAIILGIFFGDEHPWRLDTILNIVGSVMYIAAGSLAIEYHNTPGVENFYQLTGVRDNTTSTIKDDGTPEQQPFNYDSGLALGSFCIIMGIVLCIDAIVLVATKLKKEK